MLYWRSINRQMQLCSIIIKSRTIGVTMSFLLNPDIAYLMLAGGMVLAVLALLAPGTGLLEIAALFTLILAGWSVYSLPFNFWALIVVIVGGVLFVLALRKARQTGFLIASIVLLVIGSAYLFRGEAWYLPAVNPFLALAVSALSAGFFWLAGRKSIEASLARPVHDLSTLIGAVGEAKTHIHDEGSVQLGSELWSAHSAAPIRQGTQVRVIGREGFVLEVEAIES
jgi:membrane-bound ClpP family serine protease